MIQEIVADAQTEEVADGRFNAGCAFAVPVHAEDNLLQVLFFFVRDGEPDVGNLSGTSFIEHGNAVSGCDLAGVGIAAGTVITRRALQGVIAQLRQIRKAGGRLSSGPVCGCEQEDTKQLAHNSLRPGRPNDSKLRLLYRDIGASYFL